VTPYEVAALVAAADIPPLTAATLTAIALAESGGNPDAHGDPLSAYNTEWVDTYKDFTCEGYLSWGLFQEALYWHRDNLKEATNAVEPCVWAEWLSKPENALAEALRIYRDSGPDAWSTYKNNAYLLYLDDAIIDVNNLRAYKPSDQTPFLDIGPKEQIQDLLLKINSLLAKL